MDLLGKPAGPSAQLRELGSRWHCYLSMTKQLMSSLRAYSGSWFEWTQSVLEETHGSWIRRLLVTLYQQLGSRE